MALEIADVDIEMLPAENEKNESANKILGVAGSGKENGHRKKVTVRELLMESRLKSHQKKIAFPDQIKLQLGSLEINFLLSAHERVISCFKQNKRYIEKELSQLFQNCRKFKKSNKDNTQQALRSFDDLIGQIDTLKE